MAYAKYIMGFIDNFGRTVSITLSQKFPTSVTTINCGAQPLNIRWKGDESDAFKSVWQSEASISLFLPEDNVQLYEDIANLQEDQFGVSVLIQEIGQTNYIWDGWLVPDEQTRNFSYYNQEIRLLAIDPIGKLKGKKLINTDKTYLNGRFTIKDIITVCFDGVYNPDNTANDYALVVKSPLKIDFGTTFVIDIFEQLLIDSETFNDDAGRPISCFDVVETIADSFFMRCFYEDGIIYFIDKFQYHKYDSIPSITAYFNEVGPSGDKPGMFIGNNTENISGIRVFRESIAKYSYTGFTGLLLNGYLSNWDEVAPGDFALAAWDYNSVLLGEPDVFDRRVGTGRQESPYGIMIKAYNDHTIIPPPFPLTSDAIGGRTELKLVGGDVLKIAITLQALDLTDIGYLGGNTFSATVPYAVIIYNENDPTNSYRLNTSIENALIWTVFDATGSSLASDMNDFGLFVSLGGPQYAQPGFYIEPTVARQMIDIDLPGIPENFMGKVFFMIGPIRGVSKSVIGGAIDPDSSRVIISQVLLSKVPPTDPLLKRKGEIVYYSRDLSTSLDKYEKESKINTTSRIGVAGSLYSAIDYTNSSGEEVHVGDLQTYIASSDDSYYPMTSVYLITYLAAMRMWLNATQYKIDFKSRAKLGGFLETFDMSALYDSGRPSTDIYNHKFMQTSHSWDVKTGERGIAVISMKEALRIPTENLLDETHDLYEYYYMT